MEMEIDKKPMCPIIDIDGVIAAGKQFDLDIILPDGNFKKYHKSYNKKGRKFLPFLL